MVRGVIRFRRWGEFVGDGGGVTVFLGTRPLSPVVYRVPGTAPKNEIQPDARRDAARKYKVCNGYPDASMNRTRRVLRTTTQLVSATSD
jgi:hypothetical protein